ncbi:MAG: hypothetical protein A3C46_08250 [Deltaproteobacteria bacterium RIFCSPHIGHO2_02_FULL_44_16]|nr:MAG: hypothetical protein A3C46_08250 [Deltaproteobacteria bacterium RIFCSPHIGHO2_02_FULL_44_16]
MKKFIFWLVLLFLGACHSQKEPKVKNIIFVVGDGMGMQQVAQAITYRQSLLPHSPPLHMEEFLKTGAYSIMTTSSYDSPVTDSASAATTLACGVKTLVNVVGIGPDGKECESVVDVAQKKGKAIGIVSDTRLTDATPAGFSASAVSRKQETKMAEYILRESNIEVLLNGGGAELIPQNTSFGDIPECQGIAPIINHKSHRSDDMDLIEEAKKKNYSFVCTSDQLEKIDSQKTEKLLGIFSDTYFPYRLDVDEAPTIPSLSLMTQKALDILSRDKDGFFLLVEGGLIDVAAHTNDAASQLAETLAFDKALGVVLAYAEKHRDTLVLVTADHETGGFGIVYMKDPKTHVVTFPNGATYETDYKLPSYNEAFGLLLKQKKSFKEMLLPMVNRLKEKNGYTEQNASKDLMRAISEHTAYTLTPEQALYVVTAPQDQNPQKPFGDSPRFQSGSYHNYGARLNHILSLQTLNVFSVGTHTSDPVYLFMKGPERVTKNLRGFIDNAELGQFMKGTLERSR